MQWRALHLVERETQAVPLIVAQFAVAHPVLVELTHRAEHPHHQLGTAHFHGKHRHGLFQVERNVLGDVERERGLAHARASGDDDQIARLQARGALIQIVKTGGNASDIVFVFALVEGSHTVQHFFHEVVDLLEADGASALRLGDLEHQLLGLFEQVLGAATSGVEGAVGDLVGHAQESSHHRALAHQFGVLLHIAGARHIGHQAGEIGTATSSIQRVGALQRLHDGDGVSRLVGVHQRGDVLEQQAMLGAVEVLGADLVKHALPSGVVEQQRANHRLLGLERVRRDFELRDRVEVGQRAGHRRS